MPDLWSQVPYSYPEPGTIRRAEFDSIWAAARTRTVRVGVCGDSQETYTTSGDLWFYWLNALAAATFGNMPETPLYGHMFSGHGAPGGFMVSQQSADQLTGIGTGGLTTEMFPPRVTPMLHDSITRGLLYKLDHDCCNGDRRSLLDYSSLFNPAANIGIDVIAMRRNVAGGQVRVVVAPQNATQTAYSQPTVQTFDSTDPVLATAGTPEARLISFSGLNRNNLTYHQVYCKGTGGAGVHTAVCAARFKNLSNPAGVVFSPFSEPGYRAEHWTLNHASANTFLAACGIDVWMICMGVNDAISAGQSTTTFKSNVLAMMAILRAASPGSRFVLRVDPYLYTLSTANNAIYSEYAGVLKEIADADQRVLVINTRRRLDMLGHNATNESVAGLVDKGTWAATTAYVVGDVVRPNMNLTSQLPYVCITAHTSGASWSTDGPGAANANSHQRWRPIRKIGLSYTDSTHHSPTGQMILAMNDILGLFGATTTLRTTPNWPRRMGRLDHRF